MRQFFVDFLGPIVTAFAAIVAAYFVQQQVAIAKLEAKTAEDQLRYNVFEKRYLIYENIKDLIRLIVNDSAKPEFTPHAVAPYFVKMDEAAFLFSEEVCTWINELRDNCVTAIKANLHRDTNAGRTGTQ